MNCTRKLIRLWQVLKYIVARLIACFHKNENIWLLSERGTDARDNAYWLFQYLLEHSKDVKPYFAITADSPDINRVECYKDSLVEYGSFRHYVIYCRSKVLISTHIYGFAPVPSLFIKLHKYFRINKTKFTVMLQHGITKDNIPALYFSNTKLNLMVCGAKPEYDYMKAKFGYPKPNLQYLGFCRFDTLYRDHTNEKSILVMPTWRRWLSNNSVLNSEYFKIYQELITNARLLSLLRNSGYRLYFYPHHEVQPYINIFMSPNNRDVVILADKYHYDVQDLLKRSAILITDYSSVFFDFAYMRKPIIFYQFDKELYRANHYMEGYFNYEDSFGPVVTDIDTVVAQVQLLIDRNCTIDSRYGNRINKYFPLSDRENCLRTYKYIKEQVEHR